MIDQSLDQRTPTQAVLVARVIIQLFIPVFAFQRALTNREPGGTQDVLHNRGSINPAVLTLLIQQQVDILLTEAAVPTRSTVGWEQALICPAAYSAGMHTQRV